MPPSTRCALPNDEVVCNVTLTNPGLYPGCVPLNPFGERTISAAAQNYILQDTYFHLKNTMDDFAGSISGTLFENWAGPVNVALSGEYRAVTLDLRQRRPADRATELHRPALQQLHAADVAIRVQRGR